MSRTMSYPKQEIKKLNERLRKMEKVYFTEQGVSYAQAGKSAFYNYLVDVARNEPNGAGKFLTANLDDGQFKVRYINKTEWNKLSKDEQKEFKKFLGKAERSTTMTKIDIDVTNTTKKQHAYDRYPELFSGLTEEEKEEKYKSFVDGVRNFWASQKDHFEYDEDLWDLASTVVDFEVMLSDNVDRFGKTKAYDLFTKALNNVARGAIKKIPKEYRITF